MSAWLGYSGVSKGASSSTKKEDKYTTKICQFCSSLHGHNAIVSSFKPYAITALLIAEPKPYSLKLFYICKMLSGHIGVFGQISGFGLNT